MQRIARRLLKRPKDSNHIGNNAAELSHGLPEPDLQELAEAGLDVSQADRQWDRNDCVVIVTDNSDYDYERIVANRGSWLTHATQLAESDHQMSCGLEPFFRFALPAVVAVEATP